MGTAEPAPRPRLYLIDGSGYVYRAFHALPGLGTSRGLPTNAVYGFTNMVAKLLREELCQRLMRQNWSVRRLDLRRRRLQDRWNEINNTDDTVARSGMEMTPAGS